MDNFIKESKIFEGDSPPLQLERHQKSLETARLIVDAHLTVISVTEDYRCFHEMFNTSCIEKGTTLSSLQLINYPRQFEAHVYSVLDGSLEKLTMKYSSGEDCAQQYEITIRAIRSTSNRLEAACIEVVNLAGKGNRKNALASISDIFINQSADVYQVVDGAFNIQFLSDAVSDIIGYTATEMIGSNLLNLVHPDDVDEVKEWMVSVRQNHGKMVAIEYRVRSKKDGWIWIENNARNLLNEPEVKAILMQYRNVQSKKIADHALIQTEQRLSMLLNNTEESFIILNSRLRIITYNSAAQKHSPFFLHEELQSGVSVLDLINKEEVGDYISIFEKVFEGIQMERETTALDKDNQQLIFSHTFRPLFDKDNDIFGVFITSTNITERKKLTLELAVNADRLKTAQKIARLAYFEIDCVSKQAYCSDEFYEITGLTTSVEQLQNFSFVEELCHPEDFERVKLEYNTAISIGEDFNIEFRLRGKDQQEKVILAIGGATKNDKGRLGKLRVTLQDITDSKIALLTLQTLESRFKSLFENSLDGVILSKVEGNIISANPSICKMLGYLHEELVNLQRNQLMDLEDDNVKLMIEQRKRNGAYIGEISLKHKNGEEVPAEITTISLKDAKGQEYFSSIIRDITEKKKTENEQKVLTEELLKNNQDLQQFSYITSHNLRAPVANLISLLNLYNKENPADDFNQLLIQKFEEATNQLNETLNDLLNVLVIKSNTNVQKEHVCFMDVLERVQNSVNNLLEETNGQIEADLISPAFVEYNRIHLESIFLNLVSNAIRYRFPGRPPVIKISSYRQDKWTVVTFEDNGLGMDLNRYGDRLFGLYQRFHENKEGKGLGLYMTRSQIIAAGGKIEVESELGKGSTFKIYFKS